MVATDEAPCEFKLAVGTYATGESSSPQAANVATKTAATPKQINLFMHIRKERLR
jgi:hypothetical protein